MPALSFKARFVAPIQVGLGMIERINGTEYQPKRQTIRAGAPNGQGEAYSPKGRLLARVNAPLYLYCGMRSKRCFKIGTGTVTTLHRVLIWTKGITVMVDGKLLGAKPLHRFAQADGFADPDDMAAFWNKEHPSIDKFNGVLIRWRPVDGAP